MPSDKMQTTGSRRQVWNRTAKKTSGGLRRDNLFQDKYGNIKSRRASQKAKKNGNLKRAGWTFKKGQFGAVKIDDVHKKKGKKKSKGRGRRTNLIRRKSVKSMRGGGSDGNQVVRADTSAVEAEAEREAERERERKRERDRKQQQQKKKKKVER